MEAMCSRSLFGLNSTLEKQMPTQGRQELAIGGIHPKTRKECVPGPMLGQHPISVIIMKNSDA